MKTVSIRTKLVAFALSFGAVPVIVFFIFNYNTLSDLKLSVGSNVEMISQSFDKTAVTNRNIMGNFFKLRGHINEAGDIFETLHDDTEKFVNNNF